MCGSDGIAMLKRTLSNSKKLSKNSSSRTFNQGVPGSNPGWLTKNNPRHKKAGGDYFIFNFKKKYKNHPKVAALLLIRLLPLEFFFYCQANCQNTSNYVKAYYLLPGYKFTYISG